MISDSSVLRDPAVRPLRVRPGARYACRGDGLCCTDVHVLGPLSRQETRQLAAFRDDSTCYSADFRAHVLRTGKAGGCVLLASDGRCSVHAALGAHGKPLGCRRFPLGLVATPTGGRVTTDHRCPCRTLGERPLLTSEVASASLTNSAGRLMADDRVHEVRWSKRRRAPWATWERYERQLLASGSIGQFACESRRLAFPALRGGSWRQLGEDLLESRDGTQFGIALAWFGEAVGLLQSGRRSSLRARPWQRIFERAATHGASRGPSARSLWHDWLADEIWSLGWVSRGPWDLARRDLGTRLLVGQTIARRLRSLGARADVAAAEAVCIVSVVSASDYWEQTVSRF